MMELTLSRVCMGICGIILLSAVVVPLSNMFQESSDEDIQSIADRTAATINRFERSSADMLTISMKDILPDHSCSLKIDNGILTITSGTKAYMAAVPKSVESVDCSFEDIIEIKKTPDGMSVGKLNYAR